jgi:hypothetical protein
MEVKTNLDPYAAYSPAKDEKKSKVEPKIAPRLSDQLMSDEKTFGEGKIGPYISRSKRNNWATDQEATLREKCPDFYYISYDVSANQANNFSEYTYTEFPGGGLYSCTQSREINCRLIDFASKEDSGEEGEKALEHFVNALCDKYDLLDIEEKYQGIDHVVFMPGHNLLDLADVDLVLRLINETDDVYIKPHPLTIGEAIHGLAGKVGWNKILPKDASGVKLLENCTHVYTTTASEFSITGVALGKNVTNISRYQSEGAGVYQPFSRVLTIGQKRHGIDEAKRLLGNILACKWSGLYFDWQDDVEERMDAYFKKTQELRELYRPLAQGRGDIDKGAKKLPVKAVPGKK